MTPSTVRTHPLRGSDWLAYLVFGFVALRDILAYASEPSFPAVLVLLGALLVFGVAEPLLSPRLSWYRFLYFPVQTGLVLALGLQQPYTDFWGVLYAALCIQAARSFPRRTLVVCGLLWAVLLTTVTALTDSWPDGLAASLTVDAGGLFIISYGVLSEQQERARRESQDLLLRLQEDHAQLQSYAIRAEEIAAAEERNRLAHELRDSVNQQLFGITLSASSARLLLERDPTRVPAQLEELQEQTASALQKMRTLIAQLQTR